MVVQKGKNGARLPLLLDHLRFQRGFNDQDRSRIDLARIETLIFMPGR